MALRIGIQTWGSNGDIRPMLALARGLVLRGHTITLVVSSLDNRSYAEEAGRLGIAYRQVPERFDFDLEAFARRSLRMHGLQWLRALLEAAFFPYEKSIYRAACDLADGHDVLIGHHFLYPLKLAARQRGKPHVSVTLCPAAIPSPSQPPLHGPDLGPWGNPWLWRLAHRLFDWYLKPLGRLWYEHDQPPIRQVFDDLLTSDTLDLVAVDPLFCAGLDEVPPHRFCGFFNLEDDAQRWTQPEELRAFLEEGDAPIYCTFGSLQQAMPEWSMDLLVEAVRRVGCRAIVQSSSARFPVDSRQGLCYFIGRHPHQPVFERCRAVVHHGGAGTTHAATRAGCPAVVVPFMDEQLYWGQRLHHLGLAAPPLSAKHATPEKLAQRIQTVFDSPAMGRRALEARQQLVQRDGVGKAVPLIEALC
ncbi:MAG TPA: glycosyltransferase [Methylococcaceae bacterium]|nr:glycosyltransferase [Methylococcaceae bacterium]